MAFAIIETGGKQYKVSSGDVLKIEKLPKPENGVVTFDKVLLTDNDGDVKVGTPYLNGVTVSAEYVAEGRYPKVTVIHYKNKVRFKKKAGHRQPFTQVKIGAIK